MPNRILKESICTSDTIDELTEFQEVFFYRLLVNCDDFGRMDGRTKILSSKLFPLRPVAMELIERAIDKLMEVGLITQYIVNGKTYIQVTSWDKHQQVRAKRSKYPSPDEDEMKAVVSTCKQMISDDYICPRNPIQSESESISESESELMQPEQAHEIVKEQQKILNAAENAGFPKTDIVRAHLIDLYADYGLEKVLKGIDECATHSASSVAYLKAVLNGSGRRRSTPRVVAQDFEQRDYSDVQDEMIGNLASEIEAMRRMNNE